MQGLLEFARAGLAAQHAIDGAIQRHAVGPARAATKGAARKTDPETSKLAARTFAAGSICQAILDALGAAPLGMTTEEIAERLGRKLVSVSPRMRPLEQAGLVERRGTRPNVCGTRAVVWVRP